MTVRIIRNDELCYNDFLQDIGQNLILFNLEIEEFVDLCEKVRYGEIVTIKVNDPIMEVYQIENEDGIVVGFILAIQLYDPAYGNIWEVIELIIEAYRGNGVGKRAFEQLISQNPERKWSSTVHTENNAINGLEKMLLSIGFKEVSTNTPKYRSWIKNI